MSGGDLVSSVMNAGNSALWGDPDVGETPPEEVEPSGDPVQEEPPPEGKWYLFGYSTSDLPTLTRDSTAVTNILNAGDVAAPGVSGIARTSVGVSQMRDGQWGTGAYNTARGTVAMALPIIAYTTPGGSIIYWGGRAAFAIRDGTIQAGANHATQAASSVVRYFSG